MCLQNVFTRGGMGRETGGGGHWGTVPPNFCKNQENVPYFHWKCARLETLTLQFFTVVAMLNTLIIRAQTIQN